MKHSMCDDGFCVSDAMWEQIAPLLPSPKPHPLGCRRPHVPNRAAMVAILWVLRSGICSCSSAYRRFREWIDAGVLATFWRMGLLEHDEF